MDKAMDWNMNNNSFYTIICACNETDGEGLSETLKCYFTFGKSWFMHSGQVANLT
jgi:hypothetical protein